MDIVGFGFRPTEEELVDFYLKHKLLGDDPRVHVMPDIDLCDVEPWEVPAMLAKSIRRLNDPEWFFFSPVDFKYLKSKRINRTTKCGFWKPTGKDRDVRTWDTSTVIGTKKTLVFHKGRASKGVNANWVIHEYHAATFHENQRTFVLCRLMKKPVKTKGGTDALSSEKEESSRSMVSDYENQGGTLTGMETIFQATDQSEKCFSPIQQSLISIEHDEASFSNYPFTNAYFRNENNITQIPFETTQIPFETTQIPFETTQIPFETTQFPFETTLIPFKTTQIPFETTQTPLETTQIPLEITQIPFYETTYEDEFLNSILADENLDIDDESVYTFLNSSTQSKSSKSIYYESSFSDADTEVVSKVDGSIEDISTMWDEYPNSVEYHSSKRFKTSYNNGHGGRYLPSSNQNAYREAKKNIFQDDSCGLETSSCDSTTNKSWDINFIEISSFPFTQRSWENQYHPRPNNFI